MRLFLLLRQERTMLDLRWLVASVLGLVPFGVAAQNVDCTRSLEQEQVRGNLNIAVACELSGIEIRGNVTLFAGGSLTARDLRIRGNVEGNRADFVDMNGGSVDGNVQLQELVGDLSKLEGVEISGNVSLRDNRTALEILNNNVDGNMDVSGNNGGLLISGNFIDGHLKCSGNRPAPTGIGNRIERAAEGQCESLEPEEEPQPARPPNSAAPSVPPATSRPVSATPPPATPAPAPADSAPAPPNPPPAPSPPARDTTPPTLTLRGSPRVILTIDSPYTDAGATATDSTDGDLTSRIVVVNPVNTALVATFTITYSVSDLSGNAATPVTRTVTVEPPPTTGGGGGGGVGTEFALALLLLTIWRGFSMRRAVIVHVA
jgi:cell division septation protein DedD